MTKEKFIFKGFQPDEELRVYAQRKLDRIFSTSPSDSTPVAFLEKTERGFSGHLEVTSNHGVFRAEATGADANKLVEKLSAEIKVKLDAWKKIRFL